MADENSGKFTILMKIGNNFMERMRGVIFVFLLDCKTLIWLVDLNALSFRVLFISFKSWRWLDIESKRPK